MEAARHSLLLFSAYKEIIFYILILMENP